MIDNTDNTEATEATTDAVSSKRLDILKGSLAKKKKNVDDRFEAHFADVRQAKNLS